MRKAKDAATLPLFPIEDYASEIIAGIDEAGRGPLCGNVVAAAVILDPARPIEGLRDSKKLSDAAGARGADGRNPSDSRTR